MQQYKPCTLCERRVQRVIPEGKRGRQILTFLPRLVSRLSKVFGIVTCCKFKDSKGAYAIYQPCTDSLKVYRGSSVVGTLC